ncbi:hypothetical protein [Actinokineospora sp. UTMC 2448]|uniref:hypothetical protein n=1 Tax=Actinokineospora sp. UTMC 2448 TaxID=2268449 RepID=UPI002164B4CD|nr:hypothetical protein [Actinokineospora sp. UTMC 2448]UVS81823.1 hypothetical protein Actkin_05587 [Actinokineospora sp. UTMC 2448]
MSPIRVRISPDGTRAGVYLPRLRWSGMDRIGAWIEVSASPHGILTIGLLTPDELATWTPCPPAPPREGNPR